MEHPIELTSVDHADAELARRISEVLLAAYAVEAELLSVQDFPPLRRTAEDVRVSLSRFYGAWAQGRLVGVAEVEDAGGIAPHIAGLAVHPSVFRRGVGSRLLGWVLARLDAPEVTVSTAARNPPAIALYARHGFEVVDRWTTPDGYAMVTLCRQAGGGSSG